MEGGEESSGSVEARFVTSLPDHLRVTEKPFHIPAQAGRHGLSALINHLLALDSALQFDFLIGGEFVRRPVVEHLRERHLSLEDVVTIEYLEAAAKPAPRQDFQHDDWISCVASGVAGIYVTGCYDGVARVWNAGVMDAEKERTCLLTCSLGHTGPIRSLAMFGSSTAQSSAFVTASKDRNLVIWMTSLMDGEAELQKKIVCKGHAAAVEAVATHPQSSHFCSGAWDGSIKVWNKDNKIVKHTEGTKKRKVVVEDQEELAPEFSLSGHPRCTSAIAWPASGLIVSGSWDHSIKLWDVETQTNTSSLNGSTVVNSLTYHLGSGMIASAHPDRIVRLWDSRADEGSIVWKALHAHKDWVSSVCWHSDGNLLLSGSYDKTVKVWDMRSEVPLHTLTLEDKCLCVNWDTEGNIVAGGADRLLHVWSSK